MQREFEIGLPVQVVHRHWQGFMQEGGADGMEMRVEPAGGASTRVCLTGEGEGLDALAQRFQHYLETHGEGHVPLAGTMVSPGAPNAGMNDSAGR